MTKWWIALVAIGAFEFGVVVGLMWADYILRDRKERNWRKP